MRLFHRLLCSFLAAAMMTASAFALAAEPDFSASGLTASGSYQQLGDPVSYGSEKITTRVPGENPVLDGVSPITGEPFSGNYEVTLVTIDNHPSAIPHWGVGGADVIYEMPIQRDGSTRCLALFMTSYPDSAGPVRSARIPMASLREMWGGTLCFWGYQEGVTSVKEWVVRNGAERRYAYPYYLNGMAKNAKWFPRSNDSNHVAPHNVRLDLTQVKGDYQLSPAQHPFIFTDTGLERGEDVNGFVISYKSTSPAYVTAYQYNEATGLYDRFRNGAPYIDANTGEACSYANVIVVRTDISWANNNPSRPVIRLNGEGVCEVFQNGKYVRGTWVRECTDTKGLQNRMVFLDENGSELPMKRGKTFIQIVDNEQPVVVLADGAIEGSVAPEEQRLTIGTGGTKKSSNVVKKLRSTATPKPTATPEPTPEPTAAPTEEPTQEPTEQPTKQPADAPDSGEATAGEAAMG